MTELLKNEIIARAEKEPERLKFWIQYCDDYLDACRSVVENPPSFDEAWKTIFSDPKKYKEFIDSFSDYYSEDTWISVDEKLPDIYEVVLVYNKFHDEEVTAFLFNQIWHYTGSASSEKPTYSVNLIDKEVTHWKPLPKKPEKEKVK